MEKLHQWYENKIFWEKNWGTDLGKILAKSLQELLSYTYHTHQLRKSFHSSAFPNSGQIFFDSKLR